jgi:uncharacterized protein YciI
MKKFPAFAIVTFWFLTTLAIAPAQEKQPPPPQFKLVEFQMALLKRGPKWTGDKNAGTASLESAHGNYATGLLQSGQAVIVGRLTDDGEIRGVYVLRAKSPEEARSWAENSPAVKTGHLIVEMHPWWSEDVMKKPDSPLKFTTAYLGLLKRGEKWTPEKTPATEELQKAHLANINRLAETKKLVVAGPFGDNGILRGIFVFKVASLEEAKALAETDPAVKAGRLAIDMHPWLVPEGVLP